MKRICIAVALCCGAAWADSPVRFEPEKGGLRIHVGNVVFARYVYEDAGIHRPYFCDLRTLDGVQVTRNHPPVEGKDPTDHADYHPGLWLAFGDVNGEDFWRNKARVRHMRFVQEPQGHEGRGSFAVENAYLGVSGEEVCQETARYEIAVQKEGVLLLWDSEFSAKEHEAIFGDQEEMGLGVRVATSMMAEKGGTILNSEGAKNEAGVWGKTAAWCAYQGVVAGTAVGVCLMPHPDTFRPSWFHARDYGLLVANAFGRNAFTNGEASRISVAPGVPLRLRFGILVYTGDEPQLPAAYAAYVQSAKGESAGR